jgi:hypothetical protein
LVGLAQTKGIKSRIDGLAQPKSAIANLCDNDVSGSFLEIAACAALCLWKCHYFSSFHLLPINCAPGNGCQPGGGFGSKLFMRIKESPCLNDMTICLIFCTVLIFFSLQQRFCICNLTSSKNRGELIVFFYRGVLCWLYSKWLIIFGCFKGYNALKRMMLLKFWIRIRTTVMFCVEAVDIFGVLGV